MSGGCEFVFSRFFRLYLVRICVGGLAPVSNNLASTDHLTDCEESQDLGSSHANESQLLLVHVAYPDQDVLRGNVEVLQSRRVADAVDQRLEVRLEGGEASAQECQLTGT